MFAKATSMPSEWPVAMRVARLASTRLRAPCVRHRFWKKTRPSSTRIFAGTSARHSPQSDVVCP